MLKIKDNVDLKELEKFGFELYDDDYYFKYLYTAPNENYEITYKIYKITKEIKIYTYNLEQYIDNTLYDLIKADLIEKVSNE